LLGANAEQGLEADEGAAELEESLVDVRPAFVADGEPAEAVKPGEGALDDPAMAAETLAGLDPLAGDPAADAASVQRPSAAAGVVGLVGVELSRPLARRAPGAADPRDGIDQVLEGDAVVDVGGREERGERETLAIGHNVALRARFAAIRRVRAGLVAPFFAGTLAESSAARSQSMPLRSPNSSRIARCSACQTPACCQSRRRRQHVTPLPQPISGGSSSHGMPLRSTNRMPASAARSGTRGRPPFGFGGSGGSNGSTIAHSSSVTSGGAMPQPTQVLHHLLRF
jgi:hypothetical protein